MATTPEPPYLAVIFTNHRTAGGDADYGRAAARMGELAQTIDGYLGIETVRGADGTGITVSYWRDHEAIREWRDRRLVDPYMGRHRGRGGARRTDAVEDVAGHSG